MKPSVGRIVHFYSAHIANGGHNGQGLGPYPAIVTQATADLVNLKVLPPFAPVFDEGSVTRKDQNPERYWVWPPRED